jgi:hypothetical protein
MLAYRPSQMAAAASLLAMSYFNQPTDFGCVSWHAQKAPAPSVAAGVWLFTSEGPARVQGTCCVLPDPASSAADCCFQAGVSLDCAAQRCFHWAALAAACAPACSATAGLVTGPPASKQAWPAGLLTVHPAFAWCRALAHASCSSEFELKGCLELMLMLQKSALLAAHPNPLAVGERALLRAAVQSRYAIESGPCMATPTMLGAAAAGCKSARGSCTLLVVAVNRQSLLPSLCYCTRDLIEHQTLC